MKKVILHLLFLIILVGEFAGLLLHLRWLVYVSKPLIMIFIAGYFLTYSRGIDKNVVQLAVVAFFFSWLGDVLLMFGSKSSVYFILGLFGFLLAHIAYILLFLRTIQLSGKKSFLKKRAYWLLPYMIYGLAIYIMLFNHLSILFQIAFFVYMLALLGMSSMALNRQGNGHPLSFYLVFVGSIFFIISDSLIAINEFLISLPFSGIAIMSTYIAAQCLIMVGILKQYE